jgi:hypothetical protein
VATSLQAARMGFGFAWYLEEKIREEIAAGELKVLPLEDGGDAFAEIYLVLADPEAQHCSDCPNVHEIARR